MEGNKTQLALKRTQLKRQPSIQRSRSNSRSHSQSYSRSIQHSQNSFRRNQANQNNRPPASFKTSPKLTSHAIQKRTINKKEQTPDQTQNNLQVYKNVQTIRKVATFIQAMKKYAVKKIPKLGNYQSIYLQSETVQQQKNSMLFPWDNIPLISFELAFLILIFAGIWLSTYQSVMDKLQQALPVRIIILFFYLISIFLVLNTQRKTEKLQVVSQRTQIAWIFIKQDLPFQACAFLSVLLQIIGIQPMFYPERILFLASLHTAWRIMKKIEDYIAVSNQLESVTGIIKLCIKIFTFLHFFSLILNGMARIQNSNNWIKENGFEDHSRFQMYVNGFYWATTIMSTVGFGDITPVNVFERGVMSFMMIFCSLFFGYCVNFVGTMIGVLGESKALYEKDIRRLNKYLKSTKIPNRVKSKIKEHFYNEYQIEQVYDKESQQYLFKKMTQNLKAQVTLNNSIEAVQKSKFLNAFSLQTKNKLARQLVKKVYAPQKTIFDKDTEIAKLYLIQEGQINEFCFDLKNSKFMDKKIIGKYTKEDNTVGWGNLITGNKYTSVTKSQNYTLVYQMDQTQFVQILRQNRNDFIKFHQIREKILQKEIVFKKQCFLCDKLTHNVISCPNIHFIPKPPGVLASFKNRELNNRYHKRNRKFRRRGLKTKSMCQQGIEGYSYQDGGFENATLSTDSAHSFPEEKLYLCSSRDLQPKSQNQIKGLSSKEVNNCIQRIRKNPKKRRESLKIQNNSSAKQNDEVIQIESSNSLEKPNRETVSIESNKSLAWQKVKIKRQKQSRFNIENNKNNLIIDKIMLQFDTEFLPSFQASSILQVMQKKRLQRFGSQRQMSSRRCSRFKQQNAFAPNFSKLSQF